jgi:hypothetical protein
VASRVLVVGSDADVSVSLHLHLERAGFVVYCLPSPSELDSLLRIVAPHFIVLLMPASPDASWGSALTNTASAAKVGVRVVVVAPSREIVEPLAAVAGAERALSRAEVLSRPLLVVDRAAGVVQQPPPRPVAPAPYQAPPPATPYQPSGPAVTAAPGQEPAQQQGSGPVRAPRSGVDLMALIDEELVEEPARRVVPTRVEVNVSLVSEHNFYVGPTRRIDSGGVFIATVMPPSAGTRLQVRLGLADGRKLDLEGEVSFVREKLATTGRQPSGCGVKLFNLPGWAVEAIDRFLLARQPIVYTPS